jgi:alkylated DNA repair dioxygenase AlkB
MAARPEARQLSLFGHEEIRFDRSFGSFRRIELGSGAWMDVVPAWVEGHARLFDQLRTGATWRAEERTMYERMVDVPRLRASLPDDGPIPACVEEMRQALNCRYKTSFDRIGMALYRDGNDSVAWHGDYVARRMPEALVATVSLGAPRRFLVRKRGGGPSESYSLGWGDLVVMGGSCQRTHEHSVPKSSHAEPRIALMFRPIWESS